MAKFPPALALLVLLLAGITSLFASPGAERVVLVENTRSPLSQRLSSFYTKWHNLAPDQVCRIHATDVEEVSRAAYEREIAIPIADCLRARKRVESTYYLVLTQGIPIRIAHRREVPSKNQADTETASVDSELTMLYATLHTVKYPLSGPRDNPFYRRKDEEFAHPAFPMYLVTRLAGYSFEDIRGAVERCRGARNIGKVVLDLKNDDDEDGNQWLRTAAILLPAERVILETTPAVVNFARNVIGYASWGSNDRQRRSRKSGMQWLPGSIAAEYVSTNLRTFANPPPTWTLGDWANPATHFAGSPQSMALDYIWEGASGVSGHVSEPFLTAITRPEILFPAYLSGRNLAESYYLALPTLSWMTIIIGDPLCSLQ